MRHLLLGIFVFVTMAKAAAYSLDLPSNQAINRWSGQSEIVNPKTPKEYLKITTEGTGVPSYISWDLPEAIDMNKAFVEAYIKISDLESWQGLELRMSDSSDVNSYLAIPMTKYSDANFNWLQPGAWFRVTLSLGEAVATGTPDATKIRHISWYINDTGDPNTPRKLEVLVSGVRIVPAVEEPLLSITFDDSYAEHFWAAEVMANYNLRGTAYTIPDVLGHAGYLTQAQVDTLYKKYRWGISAHHEIPFTDFAPGTLHAEITEVAQYLIEHGYGFSAPHMAYPLGRFDAESVLPIVSQNHQTSRIASGGGETLPPADWHRLRTVNITPSITPEILRERIQKAQLHNEWLILMFHRFTDGTPEIELQYNKEEFKKLMQVIYESKIKTLPVHEVWEIHRVD